MQRPETRESPAHGRLAALAALAAQLSAADPVRDRLPREVQIYCVGGAVRDALLGSPSADHDYVVVGATIQDMIAAGFTPVGADFPVFLHPVTQDEYALARTERKSGKGYKGFTFNADPHVRLEDDLLRRDLTVNALAVSRQGALVDPYGGVGDLEQGVLRHVGPAFGEDPVRILRLARFAARWPGFTIAPETRQLCKAMVDHGEVEALVAERVWQEVAKGLMEASPWTMIQTLAESGAWMRLHASMQPIDPNTGQLLNRASTSGAPLEVRYALLIHNAGAKPMAPDAFKAPKACVDLAHQLLSRSSALDAIRQALNPVKAGSAEILLDWLMGCDVQRRGERFENLLLACTLEERLCPQTRDRLMVLAQWLRSEQANRHVADAIGRAQQVRTDPAVGIATIARNARLAFFKTHPLFASRVH